jgi:hypothetical protein
MLVFMRLSLFVERYAHDVCQAMKMAACALKRKPLFAACKDRAGKLCLD